MFRVDRPQNRLSLLNLTRFSDLNQRDHPQGWGAKQSDAYKKRHLTIRTGFKGFDETRNPIKDVA